MSQKGELILNASQTKQKIVRIAHEVLEHNHNEDTLIIAGVFDRGYTFAQLLETELNKISSIPTHLVKITLDKTAPLQSEITLDCDINFIEDKAVILTDDVLNTGRTTAYSLKPFLNKPIKKLQTAFIVDRGHTNFPIAVDFVGYSLSTTLQEHIEVVLSPESEMGVYLH